jgi:hypothetical protein
VVLTLNCYPWIDVHVYRPDCVTFTGEQEGEHAYGRGVACRMGAHKGTLGSWWQQTLAGYQAGLRSQVISCTSSVLCCQTTTPSILR